MSAFAIAFAEDATPEFDFLVGATAGFFFAGAAATSDAACFLVGAVKAADGFAAVSSRGVMTKGSLQDGHFAVFPMSSGFCNCIFARQCGHCALS
jgi:hypothetical protein